MSRLVLAVSIALVTVLALPAAAAPPVELSFEITPTEGSIANSEEFGCGGIAPVVPVCTSGVHTRQGSAVALGLEAYNYEGILESRIDWIGGSWYLRCNIQGSTATCDDDGDYPPSGVVFVQSCRSFDRTSGLPGGSGSYYCYFLQGTPVPK